MKWFGIYKDENFKIETVNSAYESKNVILATGKSRKKPQIKGLEEFEGKGISYCAICDAYFYKDKDVGVIGAGNYAISEAKHLLPVVKSVTLLTDGKEAVQNREIDIEVNQKKIKEVMDCPLCDGKIIEKKTKRGKIFYGCSNYPKCSFASWDKPILEKCPNCGGTLTEKKDKVKCLNCDYER